MVNFIAKLILFIFVLLLIPWPYAQAVLGPGKLFEQECKFVYGGNISETDGTCVLASGDHCKTDMSAEWKVFKDIKHCDDYMDKPCAGKNEEVKFSMSCCENLTPILERKAYKDNCDRVEPYPGISLDRICTECGNLKCELHETICNCPTDCNANGSSKIIVKEKTFIQKFFSWIFSWFNK